MSILPKNKTEFQAYYMANIKSWIAGAAVLLAILVFSISLIDKTVTAQKTSDRLKLVASVEVKSGDTLWSIASAYISDEYDSIHDYIDEIKHCNGIVSDEIHAGNFIIVPYYTDASR